MSIFFWCFIHFISSNIADQEPEVSIESLAENFSYIEVSKPKILRRTSPNSTVTKEFNQLAKTLVEEDQDFDIVVNQINLPKPGAGFKKIRETNNLVIYYKKISNKRTKYFKVYKKCS